MTKRIFIYKGERPSEGAINLRNKLRELGVKPLILKATDSAFGGGDDKVLVNWGVSQGDIIRLQELGSVNLNYSTAVAQASNKKAFLQRALVADNGPEIVPYFDNYDLAVGYLRTTRGRIYARTKLTASSGDGIILMMRNDDPQNNNEARRGVNYPIVTYDQIGEHTGMTRAIGEALGGCRLYTVGHIGPRVEWRAHIFNGQCILLQKKVRTRQGDEEVASANTLVRNLDSGWVYSVNFEPEETDPIANIKEQALKAIQCCGLTFGAVDIIVDRKTGTPRVLEVNTAPGLDENGSAVNAYANAILAVANE